MEIRIGLVCLIAIFPRSSTADFVCYHDEQCADNETRPVFVLGSSLVDCCGTPDVRAGWELATERCTNCGLAFARRVSPQFVVLSPPSEISLEIEATGYTAITWLVNGTDMHDFERVSLERFSKKFVLVNATSADAGVYEADVHMLDGTVETVVFYVFPFRAPSVSASVEIDGPVLLSCVIIGFPPPTVEWLFHNGLVIDNTFYAEPPPSGFPQVNILYTEVLIVTSDFLEFTCQATIYYNNSTFSTNSSTFINEERPSVASINSQTVIEGQSANLSCLAQGQPLPILTWLFHGLVLTSNETIKISSSTISQDTISSVLTIENVSYGIHRGIYTCLAENFVGEDMGTVELSILSPPRVTVHPSEVLLNPLLRMNETIFTCTAVGNSRPEIRWERNGEPLSGVCTMCDLRSTGEACETEELLGEASPVVGEAPLPGEAGQDPLDTGDSLDMSGADFEEPGEVCYITTYPVDSDTIVSVLAILNNDHFPVSTRFTCVGENGVENMVNSPETASAELVILSSPYILQTFHAKTEVVVTTQLILVCEALTTSEWSISWYKDSQDISQYNDDERLTIIEQRNDSSQVAYSTLTIDSVAVTDIGEYRCDVTNSAGTNSTSTTLTVLDAPTIMHPVQDSVQTTTFPSFSTTSLHCISSGYPTPEVHWTRNGNPISCNEVAPTIPHYTFPPPTTSLSDRCYKNIVISGEVELVILNPRPEDEGKYTCLAENSLGTANISIQLLVNVEPTVMVDLISESIFELDTFSLSCLALNIPTPQVSWLKDNTLLMIEDLTRVTVAVEQVTDYQVVSTLTIEGADPEEDGGVYQCRIDDFLSSSQAFYDTVSVTVEEKNNCLSSLSDQLRQGQRVSLCSNDGVCIDELGSYSCRCTPNFTGENCTIPVTVQEEPSILTEPENMETEYLETVRIYCEAQGIPTPLYSWFKDGLFVRNVSQPYLELIEVEPSQRGLYHCVATNNIGSIESSSGLLTIDGVFQYSALFACNHKIVYEIFLEEMSAGMAGETVADGLAEIISVTARPVRTTVEPIHNQFLVTVVANGVSSPDLFEDLHAKVAAAVSNLNCTLISLKRFDGCPEERTALSEEYGVFVLWPESEIGNELITVNCPCGELDASDYGSPNLTRKCGGSFTYGAEWEMVDSTQCNYTENTYKLCRVTQLSEEDQATELARVTQQAEEFRSLDFAIASLVIQNLAQIQNPSNRYFQSNFTRSYSNLLNTKPGVVREGQREFQAASKLLNSLEVFGMRVDLTVEEVGLLQEEGVVVGIEVFVSDENDSPLHVFQPQFEESDGLVKITTSPLETPLDSTSISLSNKLLDQLGMESETLRILNIVQNDLLFVTENKTEDTIGNLIISASIFKGSETLLVEDVPTNQAVLITFNVTKALNNTYLVRSRCVYWEHSDTSVYGRWSEEGCEVLTVTGRQITCRCNHLTHFGVLMDIEPDDRDPSVEFSLQIISYVGCLVSILLLSILLITYLATRKLREKVIGRMLLNSCTALIGVYTTFLLAIHGDYYREANVEWFCYLVSGLLQYFLLAYFIWTALEAFQIGLKLVKVFGTNIKNYVLKSALIAWGVPLLIVGLSTGLGIKYDMFTVKREENIDSLAGGTKTTIVMCRAEEIVFYAGILAPFILTYTFNLIIYFIIMGSLGRQVANKSKDSALNKDMQRREYKRLGVVAFFLAIMFGLAWIFAILVAVPDEIVSYVAQYLFSIFIGFQGLLYFVMHVLRSPDARRFWLSLFFKPCPGIMPDSLKTWTTTSPQHAAPTKPTNLKSNPLYSSQENLLRSQGESIFNTLERGSRNMPDLAAGLSTYSLASQTINIDFTIPTIIDDDEDSCISVDLQELIASSRFSDPNAPGVAVSSARIPPMTSSAKSSPLIRHGEEMTERETKLKSVLERLESREDETTAELKVMDLAYDNVLENSEDTDSISREDSK